ncbi:hypothetical protein E8E13_001544 [Curvularia kusanoi]|uniref:Uncharacterized protein n=1 Tax=Curvularia kusanoi TaxID=90978 RepID=A0A9P4T699_CURKU|nr:hypothetical protein E8E13_001544 [Curvularia kusanoi]
MGVKRVAVIGLGPSGAISIDALAQEQAFDVIRVFERREAPGGCWLEDHTPPPNILPEDLPALATRTGDATLPSPTKLPAKQPKIAQARHAESSVYPYLETNVDSLAMCFSQEPIPEQRSELSISKHGADTPFRSHAVIREYVESLVRRNGYEKLVSYNTSVELAEKIGKEWRLVLRRENDASGEDEWWEERFDAVIVASGHFNVPYIPYIEGLEALERAHPGTVKHSKMFRGREAYRGKRVVIVGASVSGADIAYDLINCAQTPVHTVTLGHKYNSYFGPVAFEHPSIVQKPSISHITVSATEKTLHFIDGTSLPDIDYIIFGTGYSWSLPFLPSVRVRNNRVPNLYQHVVYTPDPTLLFVGAVGAGLTFKIFEWQAVFAASILSGRGSLPSLAQMQRWEADRIKEKGDGPGFAMVYPQFEEYFEEVRRMAGEPQGGKGRRLPRYDRRWFEVFMQGHERRKEWWRGENEKARQVLTSAEEARARL